MTPGIDGEPTFVADLLKRIADALAPITPVDPRVPGESWSEYHERVD